MSKVYNPYKYISDDKAWRNEGGKKGRVFNRTEKEMCERHSGNVYTKGQNLDYIGCESAWCCELLKPAPSINSKPKVKLEVSKPQVKLAVSKPLITKPLVKFEVEKHPLNKLFIENLLKLETILKFQGDHFRSKAYRNAKETILSLTNNIYSVSEIKSLPKIGPSILKKLQELVDTGKISVIEKYSNEPEQLFNKIYGIGPKKAIELHKDYGINTLGQLKTNSHLLNSKQQLGLSYYDDLLLRIPRTEIDEYNDTLKLLFNEIKDKQSIFKIVGSYRRGESNSGDIDIIISDPYNNIDVYNNFLNILIERGILIEILSRGKVKCLGISRLNAYSARRIDFLFTPWEQLGFATLYFTGSRSFNIGMRSRALDYGLSMNEHKFSIVDKTKLRKPVPLSFPSEQSIFEYLDLEYKHPEERIDVNSITEYIPKIEPTKKKFIIKPKKSSIMTEPVVNKVVPTVVNKVVNKVVDKVGCKSGNLGTIKFTGDVLLAKEYIDKNGVKSINPVGWWASEKFDGYRAVWNGENFVSRTGKPFIVPEWFSSLMPPSIPLDGELWLGRGHFEKCGIFKRKIPKDDEWIKWQVMYNVFDLPASTKPFEERMIELQDIVEERCKCVIKLNLPTEVVKIQCPIVLTKHTKVISEKHLDSLFKEVVLKKGEGVMIRQPGSKYEQKRSNTLLKYKQFFDTECTIVGYKKGTGKYSELLGSFECQLLKGNTEKHFFVSGMNDEVRTNYKKTHPIGTVITIVYNELTKLGIPRHNRYQRKREDHGL